jgi:antibiotic biosynthesis monooxygenase (ABM) superfamily enzyme
MSQESQTGLHGGRLFVLAWIGVYPIVTLISLLFGELLLTIPLVIRTLILSGLIVAYMVFIWIPILQRFSRAR